MRITDLPISIHALREEGDFILPRPNRAASHFYPRPPRGGRRKRERFCRFHHDFYPRPPRGGRPIRSRGLLSCQTFLSTPSARRATPHHDPPLQIAFYFYPRPPRGGRLGTVSDAHSFRHISIHALREEGDVVTGHLAAAFCQFLSTPSARRATNAQPFAFRVFFISIHALREEGDRHQCGGVLGPPFIIPACRVGGDALLYREMYMPLEISIHALREEGDCSGRRPEMSRFRFLSTPSARRATRCSIT